MKHLVLVRERELTADTLKTAGGEIVGGKRPGQIEGMSTSQLARWHKQRSRYQDRMSLPKRMRAQPSPEMTGMKSKRDQQARSSPSPVPYWLSET